jgi:hypothetical protein
MKISQIKIKLFGKTDVLFRVLDSKGEVLQVLTTQDEAQAWIDAQA